MSGFIQGEDRFQATLFPDPYRWPFAAIGLTEIHVKRTAALRLRSQPVDATHWLNRSAGVFINQVFQK